MATTPIPLTATTLEELRMQLRIILRDLYEERIAGYKVGDVLATDDDDVLGLTLASISGLEKYGGTALRIKCRSGGGAQITSDGLSLTSEAISVLASADYVMPALSTSNTDAENATLLSDAIASNAAVILLPKGTFSYNSPLTISRALRIEGTGSTGRNTGTGTSMSRLQYTGTGVAMTLNGESANGTYNIHLSNFSLLGNENADGGILVGASATTPVLMSSMKNINIDLFTKAGAYGLKVGRCQQSVFENVHAHQNYYNVSIDGLNTTLTFRNCHAVSAAAIGWYIAGLIGASFHQCLAEANVDSGLYIYSSGCNTVQFFNWHSESNSMGHARAATVITGSGDVGSPIFINFFGGYFGDDLSGVPLPTIELDYAMRCMFFGTTVPALSYITVSNHTSLCVWNTCDTTAVGTDITGNASGRMNMVIPTYPT